MNTNSIHTISKYLFLFLLILTGASCNDNDDAEDTSIPVLISQNINDGDVVGPNGYVELTFSKAMRQAPDTEIYFNGGIVRVSINYERVRYTFSGMENKECSFEIPAGALTDMQGRAYDKDFFLNFTAKSEISGGGKVFNAVVDSKGNGDFTTIQAAIDAAPGEQTSPYKIFIVNGSYNETGKDYIPIQQMKSLYLTEGKKLFNQAKSLPFPKMHPNSLNRRKMLMNQY